MARGKHRARFGALTITVALLTVGATPAWAAAPARPPIVSLGFDDGRVSQAGVEGLLASRHVHATFFIISRQVDTGNDPESLTWAQVHRLARDGNEIAGHTRTHPHLPTLTPAQQSDEICGGRQDLIAQGFHPISFAYPYGEFAPITERIVRQCGYANGRGAWGGPETLPPPDRYAVRTLTNVTTADSVAHLESYVTTAQPGQWLNFVFHDVGGPTPGGDQYRIATRSFVTFLDWLTQQRHAGRISIQTIGQVLH
jgi:peptidoglycan/xylan/chitin deacetylase (PgdA/CDA1 family)